MSPKNPSEKKSTEWIRLSKGDWLSAKTEAGVLWLSNNPSVISFWMPEFKSQQYIVLGWNISNSDKKKELRLLELEKNEIVVYDLNKQTRHEPFWGNLTGVFVKAGIYDIIKLD